MWNAVVLAVLIAVAGVYATKNLQGQDLSRGNLTDSVAAEMGIYRNAVVNYFSSNDVYGVSVSTATLKSGGFLPAWSKLFQQTTPLAWGNYRSASGTIYIFALSLPTQNIASEVMQLSQNSILVGIYRSSASTLQSPVYGDTGIPVSDISGMSIPDGSPVWIAMTK